MESRIMFLIALLLCIWFIFTTRGKEALTRFIVAMRGDA